MKLLLVACLASPVSLLAQSGLPNQPYIYVQGKAEIEKPPDMVTLHFNVVARNADSSKANQEVQAKAIKVLALLKEKKIDDRDIIAADLRSEPQFEDNDSSRNKGRLIGYTVTRDFAVKVRDLPLFPKLVDALFGSEGTEFSSIDPGLTKEEEMRSELWEKALLNAREQADKTVKTLDMKIDSVFALSPTPFLQIRGNIFGSEEDYGIARRTVVTGPPEYPLGLLPLSQNVHVIYLISAAK